MTVQSLKLKFGLIRELQIIKNMKNWLKVFAFAAIICILAIAYMWFFMYNKPHKDFEKANPDYVISAIECYNHYAIGKNTEENNYTGKVLQISGTPSSIENNDSTIVVVFAFNSGMFGDEGIRCTMLQSHNEKAKGLTTTRSIIIKGFCSGYNDTDVILEQCSIVTK